MSAITTTAQAAVETTSVGNPILNISIFGAFVAVTLIVVLRASRSNKTAADYYGRRPVIHRAAERHRNRWRLSFCGILPRNLWRHRH